MSEMPSGREYYISSAPTVAAVVMYYGPQDAMCALVAVLSNTCAALLHLRLFNCYPDAILCDENALSSILHVAYVQQQRCPELLLLC